MILRHITLKEHLKEINASGYLDPDKTPRKRAIDADCVTFECNPKTNVLIRIYPILKSNCLLEIKDGDQFELQFDGDLMKKDGIEFINKVGTNSKDELKLYIDNIITQEEWDSIGEYIFIRGKVSLKYLTSDSKMKLERFLEMRILKEDNI